MMKRLTLPGAHEVGITHLDSILEEVAAMKLADEDAIGKELLRMVKIYNYVAPPAEGQYRDALLGEYRMFVRRQT